MKKVLLCAAVIVFSAGAGRAFAGRNIRRSKLLNELTDELRLLRVRMLDGLMPLDRALEGSRLPFIQAIGAEAHARGAGEAWLETKKKEIRRGGALDCLETGDIEVLDRFFAGLGTTVRSGQHALFSSVLGEMELLEAEAGKRAGEKARLYPMLGLLAGAAAVIAFI